MASVQKIVFIGAGNLATYLSAVLKDKSEIIQVYSKTLANAKKLGKSVGCSFTNDLTKITTEADLYIIAVKDDAIGEVSKKLRLPGKIAVHTSGSVDMDAIKNISDKTGVIWPLYSFTSKTGERLKSVSKVKVPFFIEASDKKTEKELTDLIKEINGKPYHLNSEKRAIVHLGAVFANNFSNHLFTIAESLSGEAGVPFHIFFPIAAETAENLNNQSPSLSQSGPASRKDKKILNKQMVLLKSIFGKTHPEYKEVYKVLTKSIIQAQLGKKKL